MKRRAFIGSGLAAAAAVAIPRRDLLASVYWPAPRRPQDLTAITGDGREVTIPGAAIAELRDALRGRVLLAGDEG